MSLRVELIALLLEQGSCSVYSCVRCLADADSLIEGDVRSVHMLHLAGDSVSGFISPGLYISSRSGESTIGSINFGLRGHCSMLLT